MITSLFNTLLYQPIFNALIFLYNLIPDFGAALILLTVIIRLALFPLSRKSIRSQKEMSAIQPEIKKLQQKHKDDKQKQAQALMALYKERKINPMSGCLPLLIQLPILIALYRVLINVFKPESFDVLYSFVARPETVNPMFLGFIDLSLRSIPLAILAGIAQFFQAKMIMPKQEKSQKQRAGKGLAGQMSSMMSQQMTYFMPVITVLIALGLPGGLPLYWLVSTVFTIGQQYLTGRIKKQEKPVKAQS